MLPKQLLTYSFLDSCDTHLAVLLWLLGSNRCLGMRQCRLLRDICFPCATVTLKTKIKAVVLCKLIFKVLSGKESNHTKGPFYFPEDK